MISLALAAAVILAVFGVAYVGFWWWIGPNPPPAARVFKRQHGRHPPVGDRRAPPR